LPQFENALRGVVVGQVKSFPTLFPVDYEAAHLAGQTVDFEITVKAISEPVLPLLDADFARALGVADGSIDSLRAQIRTNLEREVLVRLKARTKDSVMAALLASTTFAVPKALVQGETENLVQNARASLQERGITSFPDDLLAPAAFAERAERRVRLGLLIGELVRQENLKPKPQQIRQQIENLAQGYEKPEEMIQWYLGNRERLAELESIVLEDNVVEWILARAQTTEVKLDLDAVMGRTPKQTS
jgi:trigger factor